MFFEKNIFEYSKYAEGLAHPVRLKIMDLLIEKGPIYQSEIVKQLRGTAFEKEFRTIQTHLKKMESCGLLEISKDEKDITTVMLKKKIEIIAEDV